MDPVTHALAGAAVSYAFFGRKLGRRAAAVGLLAGIAPDVDHFISSNEDPLLYVQYHRQFTHSLLFALLGSAIAILPWLARRELRPQWKTLWLCALPAYLSHCLLDASTTWGTQLYWPFSNHRAGWDLIAIVDPLFTLILAAAVAIALFRRQEKAALLGVMLALSYLVFGGVQNFRAVQVQKEIAQTRGHIRERSEVMPTLGNNIVWRSIYLANGQIHSDRIRVGWLGARSHRPGTPQPQETADRLTPFEREANAQTRGFDRFAWFADQWVARSPSEPSVLGDMRYSLSGESYDPVWGIRFVPLNNGARLEWISRERNRRPDLANLWGEISGRQ